MKKSFSKTAAADKPVKTLKANGVVVYKLKGELHRLDGPAVQHPNGTEEWYKNGLRHRDGGPAYRDPGRTEIRWYQNGMLHREDGPAIIDGLASYWLVNSQLHRIDGPAIQNGPDGDKFYYRDIEFASLGAIHAQRIKESNGVPPIRHAHKIRPLQPKKPKL